MDDRDQYLLDQLLQKKIAEQTQNVAGHQRTRQTTSSTKNSRSRTAILRRDAVARLRVPLERGLAVFLLLISFSGAMLWGGGGLNAWLTWQINIYGAAAAFVIQGLCTTFQYAYAKDWYKSLRWWIVLGISTTTTVLGYLPITEPYITNKLLELGIVAESAPIFSTAIIIVLAALIDFFPEHMLLD